MSDIIGVIVALFIIIAVGIGVINYNDRMLTNQSQASVAQQVAWQYNEFGQALNAYVNANFNNNIIGTVTCATLKSDNFLSSSFSCTDVLGETLEGDISEPWGFPQSWIVYPSTAPDTGILAKYGLNNELQWKSFTYLVSADVENMDNAVSAFSVSNGSFTQPQSDVSDNLSDYFPTSGTEFSSTAPNLAYNNNYSFFVSPALQKTPDYWVFNAVITENYNNGNPSSSPAQITYTNLGGSAVCPQDGLIPTDPGNWEFTPWTSGAIMLRPIGAGGAFPLQTNQVNLYFCIPSPKNIINTDSDIFSNIGPVTSLNYSSDQVTIVNNQTFNGAANSMSGFAPQVGRVYDIKVGMAQYTLIEYMSLNASGYYNNGSYQTIWGAYIMGGGILWQGAPSASACVISTTDELANEVFPNAPAPCWNAINDLGLTTINLG